MEVKNENSLATLNPKSLPATLRIGVTGHRDLKEMETIVLSIRQIINHLDDWFKKKLEHTPYHTYAVVSPLAEGADRLVANEVLHWKEWRVEKSLDDTEEPQLEAVLPLPEEDYILDFTERDSRDKFYELYNRRTSVKIFPPTELREKAYETAGHYVVDNCDVLIAIWDGKRAKGRGGTAEIVKYTKNMGRHIFWINSENGQVKEIKPKGIGRQYIESLKDFNELNAGHLLDGEVSNSVEDTYSDYLAQKAKDSKLSVDFLLQAKASFLPWFVRADLLAQRYQKRHNIASSAVYWLSALAVIMVAMYVLFFPIHPIFFLVEVGSMAIILLLLGLSHRCRWQQKWIDYRFLAERLRAGIFLRLLGIEIGRFEPPPYLSLSHRSDDWMITTFIWIWKKSNLMPIKFGPELKEFLRLAWIEDQASFYERTRKRLNIKHKTYSLLGYGLFILTLAVGLVHFSRVLHPYSHILSFMAIALPGIGAAVHSIRALRDYHRIAERYRTMAEYLSDISSQIPQAKDLGAFKNILNEANEMMLREHQDWRVVVRFHRLTLP